MNPQAALKRITADAAALAAGYGARHNALDRCMGDNAKLREANAALAADRDEAYAAFDGEVERHQATRVALEDAQAEIARLQGTIRGLHEEIAAEADEHAATIARERAVAPPERCVPRLVHDGEPEPVPVPFIALGGHRNAAPVVPAGWLTADEELDRLAEFESVMAGGRP